MLFLLGLPGKIPDVHAAEVDLRNEAFTPVRLLASASRTLVPGPGSLELASDWAAVAAESVSATAAQVVPVDFKTLHGIAFNPGGQQNWANKTVEVVGQFAPHPQNKNVFTLARYRIQCCGADAIQLDIPIICRESVEGFRPNSWVQVTGRVEFRKVPGRGEQLSTYLIVPSRKDVKRTAPEPDPYIR
jgi:uncharacterized membrane protein YcgQ (UPF0703/DUF1980 family)